jgi:hypothetical protein
MACPFLEYRDAAGEQSFDEPRAYCTAAGRFVQPMRADVCNDRYDLDHATDCEIYLAHADEAADDASPDGDAVENGDGRSPTDGTEGSE